MRRHFPRLFALAVPILLVGAVVFVTAANGKRHDSRHRARAHNAAASTFSVLDRPTATSDALPPSPTDHQSLRSAGVDVSRAHRVRPSPTSEMWVTDGPSGSVCKLIHPSVFRRSGMLHVIQVQCPTFDPSDKSHGIAVATQGVPPTVEVDGLVPNGVNTVTLYLEDGSTATAPVDGNAFDAVVPVGVAGGTYQLPDGSNVVLKIHSCTATC